MSQPCCFAHHSVTAESMPPERRMIARSMERTVFMRRDARRAAPGRRLPTHKYLSQTRPTGGGEYLMRPGAGADGTDAKGPGVRPRLPRSVRPAIERTAHHTGRDGPRVAVATGGRGHRVHP